MTGFWKAVLRRLIAYLPLFILRGVPNPYVRERLLAVKNDHMARHARVFTVTVRPFGFRILGNTTDVIQRMLYTYRIWEPEISYWAWQHLRPGDTVVDVGANIGYFSLLSSRRVGPEGQVLSFEPVPSIFLALNRNLAINQAENVHAYPLILGDREGDAMIYRATESNLGNSATVPDRGFRAEGLVARRRADAILAERAERIRLIKIDVEGDELAVLRGLGRTLAALPLGAAVIVEVTPAKLAARGHTADQVWQMFDSTKWKGFIVRNDYSAASYASPRPVSPVRIDAPPKQAADIVFLKTA